MDLRTRTSLLCGALAVLLAASMLLRGRVRRQQIFFALFSLDVGLWYLAQWLYHVAQNEVWWRFTALLAVALPLLALHLFEAIFPLPQGKSLLVRVSGVLAIPCVALMLSPIHATGFARGIVFTYVFGLIAAGLVSLWMRGERSRSRATQRRVRFVVLIGALAALFTLADFLWFLGAPLPPVGAVLCIVFLYVLSESFVRDRLVDLYEMLGRAMVSTTLAFALAGIFYLFVEVIGGFQTMYLNAILAAIGMLTLFEPMRDKVEAYIHRTFRERLDLERAVTRARKALVHVLQVDEMVEVVMPALESSRRATGAALYLRDPHGSDFRLAASFGPAAPPRIEGAALRALIDRLAVAPIVLESVAAEIAGIGRSATRTAEADLRLLAAAQGLDAFKEGVCLGIRSEASEPLGILVLVDDRVSDAFSAEDVVLLESLALQIGVVVENSLQYRRLQERDRLAALGQMAAGLAHEVKNPLGAIKGAAQLLADPGGGREQDPTTREFVGIIVEEVDRLDRVVRSVLDYGRPAKGNPGLVDVSAAVKRTLQVLSSSREKEARLELRTEDDLPKVRVDEEQLRQVLMNLVRNAEEAMAGVGGEVVVTTRRRPGRGGAAAVEIAVEDRGPGVPPEVQEQLFVPFFTTKPRGTGLGLPISQRMVQAMGGRIEVSTPPPRPGLGRGAVFTIVLPAVEAAASRPPPAPDLSASVAAPGDSGAPAETDATRGRGAGPARAEQRG